MKKLKDCENKKAIVAGYGPAGRLVAEELERYGFNVVVVDTNADTILQRLGRNKGAKYGSCLDEGVLRRAGIERANVFVIAIPNEGQAIEAV